MRILVTGATGFVGTHLCRELEEREHEVCRSDLHPAAMVTAADLARPGRAGGLVESTRPEYVVHLAARYGRLLCADEPHRSVSDNAAATTELAGACAERGIPVLYASSSEVYGDHGHEAIYEDSELRMPTTIYGLSKRWGEEALRLHLKPEDLLIVRMNMLYGPEQLGGYGRCSLATFIRNAVRGVPFVVHSGTSRSWLYIGDAVRALADLLDRGAHGIFNLGHPDSPVPMTDVAAAVARAIPGAIYAIEEPPARTQIRHKNYDCEKLLWLLDWRPRVGLADGIRHTVGWAKGQLDEEVEHVTEAQGVPGRRTPARSG